MRSRATRSPSSSSELRAGLLQHELAGRLRRLGRGGRRIRVARQGPDDREGNAYRARHGGGALLQIDGFHGIASCQIISLNREHPRPLALGQRRYLFASLVSYIHKRMTTPLPPLTTLLPLEHASPLARASRAADAVSGLHKPMRH